MELESAIPAHLQQPRTVPARTPDNYQPPVPAYSARFPIDTKDLVIAIIGVQRGGSIDLRPHSAGFKEIVSFVEAPLDKSRPRYWEAATVTDNRGYFNETAIAYWQTKSDYEQWSTESGFKSWWASLQPEMESGWLLEVLLPSIDRFETVFSDNNEPEGAAFMREGVSGPIKEHVYWGSMRDRLPVAQVNELHGDRMTEQSGQKTDTKSQRVRVAGRKNLAIIRSGQDWSNTNPHERELYLNTMHPVLITGMTFLRDEGDEVGCINCRFMDVVQKDESVDKPTDKTFGLAYFDQLESLESWSKGHKTHLDIFGRFMQYAGELQGNVSLRLFHEVMVLDPGQQFFEYVGCHSGTGMLASL
ncbi:unnamed protein product [Zymoseptoria tritici ST99CH_1E4]|uniref:Phenylacetaldoxime dehydratase n=1 Tax=Zymoseptoria tritici ST99CH_1E4 TaxID=1276532 RepID=A0A2H1FZ81_ZYMTR|nr:unnamed protein product [Zymoseptoria tritici ST99CH_1E4]